jgi:hypothetical protein
MPPQLVQYLAVGVTLIGVLAAAGLGLAGQRIPMFACVAIIAAGALVIFTNRCPRCGYPVRKKSGSWPLGIPKPLGEKHCANCGLDLSKSVSRGSE